MTGFSTLEVSGPTVTDLTVPFWEAASEGRLIIQRCRSCGKAVFYPRPLCPHCWADALTWEDASGEGRLKSFSEIWKPGHPGWLPVAPYYVGLVELAEGATMLSHIIPADRPVETGAGLVFAPTHAGGRVLPFFKISDKARSST